MRLLLDTHTLIWWMTEDTRLSKSANALIEQKNNAPVASVASAWEIATKVRLGRLPTAAHLAQNFVTDLTREGIEILPISATHGILAGSLPGPHKDPFDRMLLAQALIENVAIVSNDKALDGYHVKRIW